MPTPTTPPERDANLAYEQIDDEAPTELTGIANRLNQTLQPQPAPPQVHTALDDLLRQRVAAQAAAQQGRPTSPNAPSLSRRDALKAGAASMAFLLSLNHIGPAVASELARLAGGKPMTGPRLASIIQANRNQWQALLAQVGADRMEIPGVEGEWSVKEIVAHLTWYESGIIENAQRVANGRRFVRRRPEGLTMDEWNAQLATESRSRPLADVLAEADEVFTQILAVITACPEELLNDRRLLGLPDDDDTPPWMRVANNTYGHYREHEQAIRAWLARQ